MKDLRFSFPAFCRRGLIFAGVVFLALSGCSNTETKPEAPAAGESGVITLMTWNIHNLFDGVDDGFEYDEFKLAAGWSAEKYKGRVNSISAAIKQVQPPPDILMFQEIESLKNFEDIAASLAGGYSWSHFANNPGAALGIGILSKLPISETKVHSVSVEGETTPRPVLETRIRAKSEEFVIFVNHWKSKLGGDDATESVRRASARVILRRIRELWEKEPELGVIAAGDLNENYDEFFRQNGEVISALIPDDPYCAQLTGCVTDEGDNPGRQKDFIVISKNKPPVPVNFPEGTIVLFSPWFKDIENGSYFYSHNWETIDHFLISKQFFNSSGLEYDKAEAANYQPFINAAGTPASYNMKTGTGLSDHLPLLLTLKTAE